MSRLILALLVVPLVLVFGNAHAESFFEKGHVERGYDFDKELIRITEDGLHEIQWTSKAPRLLTDGEYVNYKIKDEPTYLRFESANMAAQFNKQTCTMRLYDSGLVSTNEAPMLNSVSMTVKEAGFGSDIWNDHGINSEDCSFDYTLSDEGMQVTLARDSQMMGFGNRFATIYDVHYGGEVKTTFKYTNGDVTKLNHKYGFTQNFNGAFTVQIGDASYDLSTIQNEVMFSKDDIEGKTIKIKKNGSEITYDPQNYIHQYLWAVKLKNNHVTFDFTNADKPVPVGQTLEIDPTYGYTAGTIYLVGGDGVVGTRCGTSTFSNIVDTFAVVKPDTSEVGLACYVSGTQFNTTSIPDGASITNSSLQIKVSLQANQQLIDITQITHNLAAANAETILNDANNTANGTTYVSSSNCCTSTGTKNVDLGASADTDISTGLVNNRFAVGIRDSDWTRDVSLRYFRVSAIELGVTYSVPPPNAPNGLICTSVGRQMHCSWNPSIPTSGSQNGVTNYYIGKSLNNSTFTNKTSVANVTSSIMYSYFGANKLYYFNVTASNGVNSTTSAHTSVTSDNFPGIPTSTSANGRVDGGLIVRWNTPTSTGGDPITGYKIDYCITCTSWTNLVNSTNTYNYNHTGFAGGTTVKYRMASWNHVGLGNFTGNFTGTSFLPTTGTVTITTGTVGDVIQANTTISITTASPSPVTVSQLKLYRNGSLVETKATNVNIASGSSSSNFDAFWNRMETAQVYSYKIRATVSNSTGTVTLASANFTGTQEYDPSYANALENPTTEGQVNYTLSRFDDQDGIQLKVNRINVVGGDTWEINCITQTNAEAAATRNQTVNWPGTWRNYSDVGYFNSTWDGFVNTHGYVTCFNPPGILFTTTSYTNSSLALFGIEIFDTSYGAMLGVPVGIFFLAMAGSMANKRTAPTWIIVVLAMAGTMAAIGFFTLDPLVWGLALVTGLLGVLVNQKVF